MVSSTLAPVSRMQLIARHWRAEVLHHTGRFLVAELDLGHVAQVDRCPAVALRNDDVADLLGVTEASQGADHVASLSLPKVARRDVAVLPTQGVANVEDRQAPDGKQLGIDNDLHLVFAAAEDVRVRHARTRVRRPLRCCLRRNGSASGHRSRAGAGFRAAREVPGVPRRASAAAASGVRRCARRRPVPAGAPPPGSVPETHESLRASRLGGEE